MEEREDLNGYLLENAIKIFLILNIICSFISFCVLDSKDILGIQDHRRIETSFAEEDTEFVNIVNTIEGIFLSIMQFLTIVEFLSSYKNNDDSKRILSIKYLFLFMSIHILYFFVACLIL